MRIARTHNNAIDHVLLIDADEIVVGAWQATDTVLESFATDTDASLWEPNYPDWDQVSDYGDEIK